MSALVAIRSRTRARAAVTAVALAVLLAGAILLGLLLGDYRLTADEALRALLGIGSRVDVYIVTQVRLPRVALAVLCGAALGLSGSLFQSMLANPLASPDLLGISGGAGVAAVWATVVMGYTGAAVAGAAFVGGMTVAAILLGVSRRLSDGGYRLVLAGVGIAYLCSALVGYLLKRAQLNDAQSAIVWITGSLGATSWMPVGIVGLALAVCLPGLIGAARSLPILALGDPVARGLGLAPATARIAIVVTAVLLATATTAQIGPVGFVALCAPPIARALVGHGSAALAAAGLAGALILLTADLAGQYALPGLSVPVGVVTGAVGAPYLLWLLATSKGRRA
ncbi:FecCD family ABC transporter permease [Propionicicella superfundia]|uniref:FecCD family ABC transporter permease n=1 Tax=Propionicicella superfundia TaxID=348582 RepID=UPI0004225718|nr:iron ABC transporter permease [Propionicicella superfundia]